MSIPAALALALGAAACFTDLRTREIPNWLTLSGILAGLLWAAVSGGWRGFGLALAGASVGLLSFLLLFVMGGMGGGDVKLMAAFGALVGPAALLKSILWIALLGGVGAALLVYWRHWRRRRAQARQSDFIPYAPAITAGVWLTLWVG